jgi:bacteriorhodopsin
VCCVSFDRGVILCAVFRSIVVLFCVMCLICLLCLIVLPLPLGKNPSAVKISNKRYHNNCFGIIDIFSEIVYLSDCIKLIYVKSSFINCDGGSRFSICSTL